MTDVSVHPATFQKIFQIQHRINIFIFQKAFLIRNLRQCLIAVFFQEPVIQHVQIRTAVHFHEFAAYDLDLVIAEISADQRFVLINHVIHDSLHTLQQRNIRKAVIKHLRQLTFALCHALVFQVRKTHQAVFQSQHKLIELQYKIDRLFFAAAFCIFFIEKLFFDLVTAVFAVADRIPELPVGKHIKTHLPDILLAKLRQNVGNIV